jgi:hypothetical protein
MTLLYLPTVTMHFHLYNLCLQTTVPYLNMVRMFNNGEKNLKLTAIQWTSHEAIWVKSDTGWQYTNVLDKLLFLFVNYL